MTSPVPPTAARVAVPSKGRLREECLALLDAAGVRTGMLQGASSIAVVDGLALIEMRPRDAAVALAAGALDAAFIATDIAVEHELERLPALPLGFSRSQLVLASREDDGRASLDDLQGAVVATHLPRTAARALAEAGVDAQVLEMGGSLEGACVAGLADAIVDLRQTGTSLAQNGMRVLATLRDCEALLVRALAGDDAAAAGDEVVGREGRGPDVVAALDDLVLRLEAVLVARRKRYVMLHLQPERVDDLRGVFPGLASPTVLPLTGRQDLLAVHFVVDEQDFWARLSELRAMGATGIVALRPQALLP